MLGANVVMIEAACFVNCQFDHFFGTRCKPYLAKNDAISAANDKFNSTAYLMKFDAQVVQYSSRDTIALAHKTQQKMFGANVVVLESLCLLLGQTQHSSGSLGELVKSVSVAHCFPPC